MKALTSDDIIATMKKVQATLVDAPAHKISLSPGLYEELYNSCQMVSHVSGMPIDRLMGVEMVPDPTLPPQVWIEHFHDRKVIHTKYGTFVIPVVEL